MKIGTSSCEIQNSISHNGKVGLILLATDQITLYEFEAIFKDTNILFFPTRLQSATNLTPKTLLAIKDGLQCATNTILPSLKLDVVAFSCTSASMSIGEKKVAKLIKNSDKKREIMAVTNPYTAIKNACKFLKISKIGLITPYTKEVTRGIIKGMRPKIKTLHATTFNIPNDNIVPDITPRSTIKAVKKMSKKEDIDAIFISCTNVNICRYIDKLERITKKTILTSNQVMAWDILRLANYTKPIDGFGTLLQKRR